MPHHVSIMYPCAMCTESGFVVSLFHGLFAKLKKRKLSLYGHLKRPPESVVQMREGEVEGKVSQERRTGWIDNIGSWTDGGMTAARKRAYSRTLSGVSGGFGGCG